jgi:hypothetical protein
MPMSISIHDLSALSRHLGIMLELLQKVTDENLACSEDCEGCDDSYDNEDLYDYETAEGALESVTESTEDECEDEYEDEYEDEDGDEDAPGSIWEVGEIGDEVLLFATPDGAVERVLGVHSDAYCLPEEFAAVFKCIAYMPLGSTLFTRGFVISRRQRTPAEQLEIDIHEFARWL